jgi:hypothetical protein
MAETATNVLRLALTGHQKKKGGHKDVISSPINKNNIMISA